MAQAFKTLFLVRHAKSSWEKEVISDFERPLNERGKIDAPAMANRLLKKGIAIDAFVSSPAKRAKKTAQYFCEAYKKPVEEILFFDQLYHASPADFAAMICNIPDHYNSIAVFSHNPGITEFANQLVKSFKIDDMPTCSVFAVAIHTSSWASFSVHHKEFLFFDYPKNS
jgi:phosphohistidine phosphatase